MEIGNALKLFDTKKVFFYLLTLVIIIAVGLWLYLLFESYPPSIQIKLKSKYVGAQSFDIEISDRGRGLKRISISLITRGGEQPIVAEEYDLPIKDKTITVALSRANLNIKEGPAILRVSATDRSYQKFFSGNETTIEKKVIVDLTPPTIQLIRGDRYINFGGSGLVLYRTSKDSIKSGVRIGKYFFPGYKGQFVDPNINMVFFAHPYDVPPEEKPTLVTTDAAGNPRQAPLSYALRNVRRKKRTIRITDSYIKNKVAPLLNDVSIRQGNLESVFVRVNRHMRNQNESTIRKACQKSVNRMLWNEAFHQLSNSKVEANFADHRTYVYKGKTIDQAFHLGYDLAVTRNYPVEAANNGVIIFTEDLGIYGNTVIIDHGLGIFTMYSHLSSIAVKKGENVKRKQNIGRTGETGLAIGDHLHYATLIHGVPVLPLEWWDSKWVKENILSKIPKKLSTDKLRFFPRVEAR